ncbi:DNA adenine methylase [Hahella ganghwensis]|uniref:DNA adenine methylase n=1 Tax=Hahella ganghwensis TaxID=286420 RepID=UPI000475702F|nr:DNA adenine methylase [Hahella ganghwensis]
MTLPIINWMGGKRRLAPQILPLFGEHTCYVEVFCGGGALFFMKQQSHVEVINDTNSDLVNLYRVVQHHLEEFVRQFKWALVSREMFKWLKDAHIPGLTDIQRAARFFYLQQTAFGAKVEGQSFGTSATRPPKLNLLRIEENLSEAHLRLAGVVIEKLDWADCIERYDRPDTLFYLDPPYWQTAGYGCPFDWSQYTRMAELAKSIKGRMIISINDHEDIRECFSEMELREFKLNHTVGGNSGVEVNELVYCNFDPQDRLF